MRTGLTWLSACLVCVVATLAVAGPEAAGTLNLAVTGITKENATEPANALKAITHSGFKCPGCPYFQEQPGSCEKCKKTLESQEKSPVISDVRADAGTGKLSLWIAPGHMLSITEIENALQATSIRLDPEEVTLSGWARLRVEGVQSKETAGKIEKALRDAKGYDGVTLQYKDGATEAHFLLHKGLTPATIATVRKTIESADTGLKLADVSWIGPCMGCSKKTFGAAGCADCWKMTQAS
ncbi:MAG: hypothetical protein ACREID_01090 [Planctomycetota bacterium]